MKRSAVNKGRSARKFRGRAAKTSQANVRSPLRGGYRM